MHDAKLTSKGVQKRSVLGSVWLERNQEDKRLDVCYIYTAGVGMAKQALPLPVLRVRNCPLKVLAVISLPLDPRFQPFWGSTSTQLT